MPTAKRAPRTKSKPAIAPKKPAARRPTTVRKAATTTRKPATGRKPAAVQLPTAVLKAPTLRATIIQPRFTATAKLTLAKKRLDQLQKLNLADVKKAKTAVHTLAVKPTEVPGLMEEVYKRNSLVKQINFTRAVIADAKDEEDVLNKTQNMVNWARIGDMKRKRMLCKAYKESGESGLIIHNIGGMEKKDARSFMKEYFSAGGDMNDVIEWLREAGTFLRMYEQNEPGTDGLLGKAWNSIKKAGKKAVDWVKGAVKTVGDAIAAAGKNLAKAISDVASWTASKIEDFVVGVIRAGKRVADILSEAVKKGAAVLAKFVKAVIHAGRAIREVLSWAVAKSLSYVKQAVTALMQAGKTVANIVLDAVRAAGNVLQQTVRAMLQLGKKVADIVVVMANQTYNTIRQLTDALLRAGKGIFDVVSEVAARVGTALTNVVKALFSLGKSLAQIMAQTLNKLSMGYLQKFVNAIIAAGKKVADIIHDAIKVGWTALARAAQALARAGQKIESLLSAVANKVHNAVEQVFKGLKLAGKKVAQVLGVVAKYAGAQLRNLMHGFYKVFRDPVGAIKHFAKSAYNTVRMVVEGLITAGYSFAKAVKDICVNVADQFREGFFKGLIALGKSVVDIMVEALKLTGAVAALALSTVLDLLGGHRGLTAQEKREAKKVFGASIDLDRVKIAVASIPADLINLLNNPSKPGARPFTTMYVLNFASWREVDLPTLIHELTHTWQGVVSGPVYMIEALHAQFTQGPAAYEVNLTNLAANNGDFNRFNREQQATVVEYYYQFKYADWKGNADAADWVAALEPYAKVVYKAPRAGAATRVSPQASAARVAQAAVRKAAKAVAGKPKVAPARRTKARPAMRRRAPAIA